MKQSDLEVMTSIFWDVSQSYNGRATVGMTTEQALNAINTVESSTGPHRKRLRGYVNNLKAAIIKGGRRKKGSLQAAVLTFKKLQIQQAS